MIEGCYVDLLSFVEKQADELIFLNVSVDQCIENAVSRPWEPHRYTTKYDQDENLDMLIKWIKWIKWYEHRDDVFSHQAHLLFYQQFTNKKQMIVSQ